MKKIFELEQELKTLGLFEKTREIYFELGGEAAISYAQSGYQLLNEIYHGDNNPESVDEEKKFEQQYDKLKDLFLEIDHQEFFSLLQRGVKLPENRRIRILVVEDEFGLQETFRDVFSMEGYDVQVAADGEEGLDLYHTFNPDLIFTDVVMPKLNGLELVSKIRETNRDIKVIYISGFFGIKSLKRDLDLDMSKYGYRSLSKPFKISTMLELVENYLSEDDEIALYA